MQRFEVILRPTALAPGEMEIGRREPGDTDLWFRSIRAEMVQRADEHTEVCR